MASVTDSTVGMAMGIPPISRTRRLLIPTLQGRCCIGNMTMISRTIPTAMEQMQKFPIDVRTYKKNMLCSCKLQTVLLYFTTFKRKKEPAEDVQLHLCCPPNMLSYQRKCQNQWLSQQLLFHLAYKQSQRRLVHPSSWSQVAIHRSALTAGIHVNLRDKSLHSALKEHT